jgi:hypothetical protein
MRSALFAKCDGERFLFRVAQDFADVVALRNNPDE